MAFRVLFLDDDPRFLGALVRQIRRRLPDVEFLTTTSPDEAIAWASEVDLLGVDLQLGRRAAIEGATTFCARSCV
jgi:ActR/RegA family two-component response regulator